MIDPHCPSALAMERFIARSPGLRTPQLAVPVPGLPTLPDLKLLARRRRAAGFEVIDQSAGDIDDVHQPLSPEFIAWIDVARDALIGQGHAVFARTSGDAYGFPCSYQLQYPVVTETLAQSWGVETTPFEGLHTISGRTAIDFVLRGMVARARAAGRDGPLAIIVDPLAWPGYGPPAKDLSLKIIHAPATPRQGLTLSAEGLRGALDFARERHLDPVGAIPIVPSNPSGIGAPREELRATIEVAAEADLPLFIDAFYSPLAPEGHAEAVPLGWLERTLAPEALAYLGVMVGETKVTSSQNKTATLLWFAPPGQDAVARSIMSTAMTRMRATNTYPRPQEALVAYALHTFPGGIHAAMGPRYEALEATRAAMRQACDALDLPLTIGGSFYGTAALVGPDGRSLIRDEVGRVVTHPREISEVLIERFGLVGAPGGMFSPAPEASTMVRLTAAVTLDDVQKVKEILEKLVQQGR